jgi:hypothetical protein
VLLKWSGTRVSHPQQLGLPNERAKFYGFWIVERAAAETTALRCLQNDLGNTPLGEGGSIMRRWNLVFGDDGDAGFGGDPVQGDVATNPFVPTNNHVECVSKHVAKA